MIRFNCERCGKTIQVKPEMAGRQGKCPGCQGVLVIPAAESPGPAPATPAQPSAVPPPRKPAPPAAPDFSKVQPPADDDFYSVDTSFNPTPSFAPRPSPSSPSQTITKINSKIAKSKATDYSHVPWVRKSGTNSVFLILHLLTCGAIPFLLITCVVLLTGNVYYNQKESDGSLRVWSAANKVVAFLLLIPPLLLIGTFAFAFIVGTLNSMAR